MQALFSRFKSCCAALPVPTIYIYIIIYNMYNYVQYINPSFITFILNSHPFSFYLASAARLQVVL